MKVLVTLVSAVLVGAVDLLLQRYLPYPWANLANSPAVWAIAAFTLGRWLRTTPVRAALAGAVQLIVAVEVYYVTATLVLGNDLSNLWSPATLVWVVLGLFGGLLFGAAGNLSRDRPGWLPAIAAALPTSVLLAEAATLVSRPDQGDAHYRTQNLQTAAIEAVLGLLLLWLLTRGATSFPRTVAAVIVLSAAGFGAFLVLTGLSA